MSCHDIGRGMNSVVEVVIDMFDDGEITRAAAAKIIHAARKGVHWCDGNEYEAIDSIRMKRCGYCLRKMATGEPLWPLINYGVHGSCPEEEDFEETLDVVRKVEYDTAFTFIYSKRSNTPAAEMENQVPQEVVGRRFQALLEEVQRIGKKQAEKLTGLVEEVLVEECNKQDESLMTGRLSNNLLVHFPGDASMLGKFYQVRLSECKGFYFMGEIVDEI